MPIRTPDGYLDITNATLRGSEIITTSKVGIANSAPTHTLSVGNKLFVDDSAANVLTVSGNLVATSLKIGQIDLAPSYGLEHVANVINTVSNVVQFTNTGTGFVSVSNVGIGTSTSPAGLLDVVGAFRMRYQDMGVTKAHIITGANSTSITESGGTYTYTRAGSSTTGNFLPNPSNIVPKVGQRYRVKLTARSDYAGTIRYECPTSTIITTYDLTTTFKEYTWDFTATGTTMQFAVTTASGTTSQFNAFSIERLGVGFNVNPTSTTAPVQISGVTHFSDNVGIGTVSPGVKLHLYDSSSSTSHQMLSIENPHTFGFNAGQDTGSSIVYKSRWQGDGISSTVDMCTIEGRKEHNANYGDSYISFKTRYETNRNAGGAGTLTEKLRIAGNGNVGIGTNNPLSTLEVGDGTSSTSGDAPGSISVSGTGATKSNDGKPGLYHRANVGLGLWSDAHMSFEVNGYQGNQTEAVRITTAGNVGIGTASLNEKLHIYTNDTTNTQLTLRNDESTARTGICIRNAAGQDFNIQHIGGSSAGSNAAIIENFSTVNGGIDFYSKGDGKYTFHTTNSNDVRLRILNNGNVGVGVVNPAATLDVRGASHDPSIPTVHIGDNSADAGDYGMVNLVRDATSGGSKAHLAFIRNGNTVSAMGFHNNTNTFGIWTSFSGVTTTPRLAIDPAGKVGIGTASPGNKLHIQGDSAVVTSDPSGNDYGQIEISSSSYAGWTNADRPTNLKIGIDHTTGGFGSAFIQGVVDFINAGVPLLLCPKGGKVGIGTTSPTAKLQVNYAEGTLTDFSYGAGTAHWQGKGLGIVGGMGGFLYGHDINHSIFLRQSPFSTTADHNAYCNYGYHAFYTDGYIQNQTEKMRIAQNGNVGIGTNSPVAKLIVNTYGGEQGTDCLMIGANTALQNLRIGCNSSGNYCWLQSHHGKPLRLNPAGNSTQYGTSNTTLSDDRIKDNEVYIENATDTLLKLKPQVYDKKLIWNISKLGETSNVNVVRESGLITQDVWYDAPELRHLVHLGDDAEPGEDKPVTDNDPTIDPDYSSWGDNVSLLDYMGFIPYLIKSNQEIYTKLQEVEAKTTTLETKLQTETAALETELQAEKTKSTALETKLQEAEAKIATLQAEKEAIRSDLSSLVLRVTALES